MIKGLIAISAAITLLSTLLGCSKIMGSLRRDLDDGQEAPAGPTVGGNWTERGLLSENNSDNPYVDRYAVGHSDRNPASDSRGPGQPGWVNEDQYGANRRDQRRARDGDAEDGAPSYSNNPDVAPPTRRQYKNGNRATRADFVDESTNEGSLWASDGQTNYYFTKNKIRGVGDIVSVKVEEGLVKDSANEIARTLNMRERQAELDLAQDRIRAKTLGLPDPDAKSDAVASSSAAPNRQPAAAPALTPEEIKKADKDGDIRRATSADVDVAKSMALKPGDNIMSEIIERYPNGNYKVRGSKKVAYGNSYRILSMVSIVKGSDIGEDDSVASGKLYEYRLEALR